MRTRLEALKAEIMMRIAGFIAQQHQSAWKRALVRVAVRLNLARHGRDPLAFLETDQSIDLMDYEAEDESRQ